MREICDDWIDMLNSGDVPNLFGIDEMENIANVIGPVVQSLGTQQVVIGKQMKLIIPEGEIFHPYIR